jgi:nucleoside 2-deoxyribosyltransferase
MKIYLAGPMRNFHAYNHPAFDHAAEILRSEGHEVFSPAEMDRQRWPDVNWAEMTGNLEQDGLPRGLLREIIEVDLTWIARNADAIAMLPGWENSAGAKVEITLGQFLGLFFRQM